MRALFSIILRTLAWLVWLPAAGYVIISVLAGQGNLSHVLILLAAACAMAPLAHYGYQLKYPAPRRERSQPARRQPAPDPLPEAPPQPSRRIPAVPPFVQGQPVQPAATRSATSPRLQRFLTEGAERIEKKE